MTPAPTLNDLVSLVISTPDHATMDLSAFPLPVLRRYRASLDKHGGGLLRYEMWAAVAARVDREIASRHALGAPEGETRERIAAREGVRVA